jgi:hypothetical protein
MPPYDALACPAGQIWVVAMFDPAITTDIQSLLTQLSSVPLGNLIGSIKPEYRYGYIGLSDRMMYPLITPGAIVQIDERHQQIVSGLWRRESERPIYFLETRTGFACCWCALRNRNVILEPHPLSGESTRIVPATDLDVIGLVVAVAMRLDTRVRPHVLSASSRRH